MTITNKALVGKWQFIFLAAFSTLVLYACFQFYNIKMRYAFYGNIAGNLCLQQRMGQNLYDIVQCSSGQTIIKSPFDWMVDDNFLYGSLYSSDNYYIVSLDGSNPELYTGSLYDFNNTLISKEIEPYDMSKSENIAHLLYGAGRNRKF